MKDITVNKKALSDVRNIEYLESYYKRELMMYFIENPNATEKDFIKNKIEDITLRDEENLSMWNLSDDDFYEEFRKDEKTTLQTTWHKDEKVNKQIILRRRANYEPSEFENIKLTFYKNKLRILFPSAVMSNNQIKSLQLNGRILNLSERYKIANKVLDIDKTLRTLDIPELKKYELLSFIMGCDKDNARNLMNGTYKSKDRDLTTYFDSLQLNK